MSGALTGNGKSIPFQHCIKQPILMNESDSSAMLAELADCAVVRETLGLPAIPPPAVFSKLFQNNPSASPFWMIQGQVGQKLLEREAKKSLFYDAEGKRYPLIHQLTANQLIIEGNLEKLTDLYGKIRSAMDRLQAKASEGAAAVETIRTEIAELIAQSRVLIDDLEKRTKVLEKWALQDGKDKAVSREAALDIGFQLYRAFETVSGTSSHSKVERSYGFLQDTHNRRFKAPETMSGLNFGVAAIDLNITAPNTVNRNLGDLVLDEAYEILRRHFNDSVVTKGTRTNFRIVNPDGTKLSQEMLLQVEREIYESLMRKVSENPKWKKFIEGYQLNLSAGYHEVQFDPKEIVRSVSGEYSVESVNELLSRVDQAFRVAHGRSQEVYSRLKQTNSLHESTKTPRLNHGQFPITDLNGIPEGRYFEPGEKVHSAGGAVRLVHNLKMVKENLVDLKTGLISLDWNATEPAKTGFHHSSMNMIDSALEMLEENRSQYRSVGYDVTHDWRMPRLVDRPFAMERVDAIVRETGGARLLFVELGKFYSFARTWYGGHHDQYVHELIYDFYKVLVQNHLHLAHPANTFPVLSEQNQLVIDPKMAQPFEGTEIPETSKIFRLLNNPKTGMPIAQETVIGMREGDEIGFIIGERDENGRLIDDKRIKEVFALFNEIVKNKFGLMFFDDIEKVGPDAVRTPKWQLLEYRNGKFNGNGQHALSENNILKLESEVTSGFTGLMVDYEPWTNEMQDPKSPKETANVVIGRRPRWRFFEDGRVASRIHIHYGEPVLVAEGKSFSRPETVPEALLQLYPELGRQPLLVKMQTRLTAGYVSVSLQRGSELDSAWSLANDLSKKSKIKGGQPVLTEVHADWSPKPEGHDYDKSISMGRSKELAENFAEYAQEKRPVPNGTLSEELVSFLKEHERVLVHAVNPHKPADFEREMLSIVKRKVKNSDLKTRLNAEIRENFSNAGPLLRVRDAFIVTQLLEREGLNLNLKALAPAFWRSLGIGNQLVPAANVRRRLATAKSLLVKLYVQQTGSLPPPDVMAESRKYLDPKTVFIPEEIYSLARQYKVPPEKVPYFVAGLQADKIRELGQEAFRSLTLEDLHRLAQSPEGQAFLRDPKNALLLQDNLKARVAYQGVPLLTAMLSVFPAEMLSNYLAQKVGLQKHLSPKAIAELKFGMTIYFAHTFNITASGVWEVVVNRMGAAKALTESIGSAVNIGSMQTTRIAGQQFVRVGLRSGGGLGRAMLDGVLEKWGISTLERTGARQVAWHLAKGVPRVPYNMLRTMGAGYLSAFLFDKVSAQFLDPNHPLRKYGSFVAFFAPDLLRLTLGSSRIAASRFLTRGGSLFTKAGNGLLAVSIVNFGFNKLFVDNEYESSINQRVTDRVYEEPVRWYGIPFKGLRHGMRAIAPDLIDWSVTTGNSKLKNEILASDRQNSQMVMEILISGLPKLLVNPTMFKLDDAASYQNIDFGILSHPVELNEMERRVFDLLAKSDKDLGVDALNFVPEESLELTLQRVYLFQMQQGIRYLIAVRQPENDWVRRLFSADGTLKPGMGEDLLLQLMPAKPQETSPQDKILFSRRVMVGLAVLDGRYRLNGHLVDDLAQQAGILDAGKNWILGDEFFAALSLYAGQVQDGKDERAKKRLADVVGKLQLDYLTASEADRNRILEALRCLGIQAEVSPAVFQPLSSP